MAERERRATAWAPMLMAIGVGAILAGIVGWRLELTAIQRRIEDKQNAVKHLVLTKGIPPNQEVMNYLAARQAALEERDRHWRDAVLAPAISDAAKADPQLFFKEQYHEVQRTLEQMATARGISPPELLGFPKELPPSDTVPRLLAQLDLMQETAGLLFEQGITRLVSLTVEDPETVPEEGRTDPFLMQLPVRIRFSGRLEQLMKVFAALDRARPVIDQRSIRVAQGADELLDVELLLARYLNIAAPLDGAPEAAADAESTATGDRATRAHQER